MRLFRLLPLAFAALLLAGAVIVYAATYGYGRYGRGPYGIGDDTNIPIINFVSPTPANGTYSVDYVYVNITAIDPASNIGACTLEWNGVNESMTKNATSSNNTHCFVNKTSLGNANYTYRVFANDTAGNLNASPTRHATVDTARPILTFQNPTPANNTYTVNYVYVNMSINDTNAVDTCTLEWNNTNETITRSAIGTNVFCFVNKTGLNNGNYTYRVFANDSAGNLNASETRHANLDAIAPNITFVSPTDANNAYVSRTFTYVNVTVNDTSSNVDQCTLEWNGINESMTKIGTDFNVFCFVNKTSLSHGTTYTYRVFANDTLNNTNTSATRNITIDLAIPDISFVSPTPSNGTYGVNYVYVNVSASDVPSRIDTCILEWNGVNETMTKNGAGTTIFCSVNKTALGDGNYSYRVFANDSAGNLNASATRHAFVDSAGPTFTFNTPTPANGTYSTNYVYVNVTATDANNIINACILEWNGVNESMTMNSSVSGTSRFCFVNKTSLSDGNYTYRVFANDSAGNLNASATRHFFSDDTAPTVSYVSPTDASGANVSRNFVFINITASDASNNIANCILEWNGANETMNMNGSVSGTDRFCWVNKTSLSDGTYTYRAFANDTLNNTATAGTRTITIDTAAPTVSFVTPTPANNTYAVNYVYVNVTATDATSNIDACTLEWNGVNESMTKSASGSSIFCFVNKSSLSNANYTYRVFANDSAGNLNASATRHANIDVPPPPPPPVGVVFSMEFNISGSANDAAEVDNQGTGYYNLTTSNFNNYYACEEDTSLTDTPTFGLVFAGSQLNYINLTSGNSFRMAISQKADGNKFLIAVTKGGCNNVRNAVSDVIRPLGAMTRAFVEFVTVTKNPIEIILSYPDIDIVGNLVKSGSFTLTLEKNESGRVTQIIFRE